MTKYDKYEKNGDIHWQWYFDERGNYRDLVEDSLKELRSAERGLVLDIGAGDGLVEKLLLDEGFGVVAVEPDETGVEIMKEKLSDYNDDRYAIFQGTLSQFYANVIEQDRRLAFEFMYSLNTIEHVENYEIYNDIMERIVEFGIVVTDNKDECGERSDYHLQEFSLHELKEVFTDYETEEIEIDNKCFIGIKVNG